MNNNQKRNEILFKIFDLEENKKISQTELVTVLLSIPKFVVFLQYGQKENLVYEINNSTKNEH